MEPSTNNRKHLALALLVLFVMSAVSYIYFFKINIFELFNGPDFATSIEKNINGEDPVLLQDFFIDKVKSAEKDDQAISAIYWITHRYFDNGGNIYEIYDFVNAHPEISFLKEAEILYPTIFEQLKTTKVANYSQASLLALLAYYEVIDQNGYAGVAIWGLAANKYSELALANIQNIGETDEQKIEREKYLQYNLKRSKYFTEKTRFFIVQNTMKHGKLDELLQTSVSKDDILVGLNQYASALLNLKGANSATASEFTPIELFEFNSQLALDYVPRLYFFTNYLYATALIKDSEVTAEQIAIPLSRVVEYADLNTEWRKSGSINRVINSKTANELGLFSYATTKKLASINPDFKNWLMKNGWQDNDF